jgi:hypothetical protein
MAPGSKASSSPAKIVSATSGGTPKTTVTRRKTFVGDELANFGFY